MPRAGDRGAPGTLMPTSLVGILIGIAALDGWITLKVCIPSCLATLLATWPRTTFVPLYQYTRRWLRILIIIYNSEDLEIVQLSITWKD